MATFKDKVVMIPGAASGIGAACAVHFAKLGASLALNDRNSLDAVAKKSGLAADKILTSVGDITNLDYQKKFVQEATKKFGRLDVLIYCAGLAPGATVESLTEDIFNKLTNVAIKGLVFLGQQVLSHLAKTKGHFINVSSIASTMTVPGFGVYGGMMAAADHFCRVMALEFAAKGVHVNTINAGVIDTPIFKQTFPDEKIIPQALAAESKNCPIGRVGTPLDVAYTAAFIAGEHGSFFVGSNIIQDGGRHLCWSPFGQ